MSEKKRCKRVLEQVTSSGGCFWAPGRREVPVLPLCEWRGVPGLSARAPLEEGLCRVRGAAGGGGETLQPGPGAPA